MMAAEKTPLVQYKFNGEVLTRSVEFAEITAKKKMDGRHTVVTLDVRFMDEDSEIPADLPTMWADSDSMTGWSRALEYVERARPGLDWIDLLETFRAWAAPSLPPLARSEHKRRLLTLDDLRNLPEPTWAIEGILPAGVMAVMFGPSGVGKSFIALDMALSTAAGIPWMGRTVARGPVLYVAAEGRRGIPAREDAWHLAHTDCDASSIRFLDEPVNMLDERDVNSLLADIAEMDTPPTLIVIDTLARCFGLGDENSTRDMGMFVAGAERLRRATGATVLIVHHCGKVGEVERGNSALRAAVDTMIGVTAEDTVIKMRSEKQKDAEEFTPIYASRVPLGDSCIIAPMSMSVNGKLTGKARQILAELTDTFTDIGATPTQLVNATNITERTVLRSLNSLVECGLAHRKGKANRVRYYKGAGND
jgi:Fe2+ or Zn2+ uptake regulation protein